MRLSPRVGAVHSLLRLAAEGVILFIIYRYLSDTFTMLYAAVGFAAAAAAGFILARSGLKMIWAAAAAIGGAALVRGLAFLVFRLFSSSMNFPLLDFQYFLFDSGFFPLLLPLVLVVMMNFIAVRRPGASSVEVLINAVVFGLLLWKQGGYDISLFPHPGYFALFCFLFVILELFVLITGGACLGKMPGQRRSIALFAGIIISVLLLILFLFFGRYSEGASKEGGGLMKPTLLRFDFSDYVKLESEISMNNDLVLLLRNQGYLNSVYLRRFYLSGYRRERGFFIEEGPGEAPQLLTVPERPVKTGAVRYPNRVASEQEYFIKNFDPSALIAMNYPVEIVPLTNWNESSFIRNYRVISESVELPSWELSDAKMPKLAPDLYDYYTDYGEAGRLKTLAEEITLGLDNYYDKVIAIMFYLKDKYFYSLKPGVARDGNQLDYFLFESKKGYCSYFAFSMTLMCRSLGIPARVAAGFFIDPESGILGVYPVREDMAHAWVEVPFEGFGWVEFDPTSERVAPGEDLEFAPLDSSEYADLVEEIISNDYSIEPSAGDGGVLQENVSMMSRVKKAGEVILRNWYLILPAGYLLFLIIYHLSGWMTRPAVGSSGKIKKLYHRSLRLAAGFGFKRRKGESILEHGTRVDADFLRGMREIAECYLESVFSRDCSASLLERAEGAWKALRGNYSKLPPAKRLLIFIFPLAAFGFKPVLGRGAGLFLFVSILFFCGSIALEAETPEPDAAWYLEAASREQDSENHSEALRLLNEGIASFPENWELKKAAGDLYADRELYNLAVEQYGRALALNAEDCEVLYSKSVSEGLLNLDEDSISSLERLLELEPDNFEAIADLGWMYFKTYRLDEAEELLLDALGNFKNSPIFSMTLGTVYSGKYDYQNAEKYYLDSIEFALEKGWDYFASVSYYNLSLLEHGFYNYEKALDYTNKSIEAGERAPGYIARAELYLGRLDFDSAFTNYQQAYIMDSTPLALMGLADLYLNFGMLDNALAHIRNVQKRDDDSWMYYFGVDPGRHGMEVDRLLSEIYSGLAVREMKEPVFGFRRAAVLAASLKYRCLEWYHNRRYRRASFDVGLSNAEEGNSLDSAWAFYVANEDYPEPAVKYLSRAKEIEVAAAPSAKGAYLLEEGRLSGDILLLSEAVELLDPEWERRFTSEALTELALLYRKAGADAAARQASEALYRINPGVFIREGIEFPIAIDDGCGFFLRFALRRGGFDILPNNQDISYRYKLAAADNQEEVILYSVQDLETGEVLISVPVAGRLNSPQKASAFTAELKKRLFNITDDEVGPL
ncbi:MAG: tetratricopeptide repeat protein [Spirochaetales bacterium]|nr:tetratricopeptide repeat protein [Spirochaetales bacterium]